MLGNRHVLIIIFIFFVNFITAQSTNQFYHKNPHHVLSEDDIVLSVTMFTSDPIVSGMLFFRSKNQISYQEIPMQFSNGNWDVVIPGRSVQGDGIEYVIILHKRSWGRISIPNVDSPFSNPLLINISQKQNEINSEIFDVSQEKKSKNQNYVDADILILSPEKNTIVRPDEVVIAVSLFNTNIIDTSNYKIVINGQDLTKQASIDGGIFTLIPEELSIGLQRVKLFFKT